MKSQNWLKESARDLIALGSIPFFFIVLIRILTLNSDAKLPYLVQFLFGAVLFLLLMFLFKANLYAGFGLMVVVFTSVFYSEIKFTIFVSLLYLVAIAALFYLQYNKKKIIKGILFGALASAISWYLVLRIFGYG